MIDDDVGDEDVGDEDAGDGDAGDGDAGDKSSNCFGCSFDDLEDEEG